MYTTTIRVPISEGRKVTRANLAPTSHGSHFGLTTAKGPLVASRPSLSSMAAVTVTMETRPILAIPNDHHLDTAKNASTSENTAQERER